MNFLNIKLYIIVVLGICITACSAAKLEARLEANPQCKDVVNPKTGAVMPCPGSDKAFYKSVGLEPTKSTQTVISTPTVTLNSTALPSEAATAVTPNPSSQATSSDCKPTLHKKTGGILPCPSPN
ncbi:hypothetical protein DCO17_05040 [Polynucleobacter tropicus]|uniref:Uncharacterized protein n=2 Tax=Polynucleobacter tropicus TaxID=1743174 RepID=A0A6M9Q5R1_9BURK|nr:hypothetical protein DCO17_05040 [Polynucleobacter tropicus]